MNKQERQRHNREVLLSYGLVPLTPEEAEVIAALTKFEEAFFNEIDRHHEDRPEK